MHNYERTIFSSWGKGNGEKQVKNGVHPHQVGRTGGHHGELSSRETACLSLSVFLPTVVLN